VVGALFSFAGIYYGGTLPFVALGPNLVEGARSLVPQYLETTAILLGLLFALKFRQLGRSGRRAGRAAYHLALAGLLLVILANLGGLALTLETSPISFAFSIRDAVSAAIVLGLLIYLLGLFLLYRGDGLHVGVAAWVERLLLAILPLAIPLTFMLPFITWKAPVSSLYGTPLLWVMPHALSLSIGLFWLGLSVWVVTKKSQLAGPFPAEGSALDRQAGSPPAPAAPL
jgi:hypothetical protein